MARPSPQRGGFAYAALEHFYRKDYLHARIAWQEAHERNPALGPFEEIIPFDHLGGIPSDG